MFMTPGCAWRRSLTPSARASERASCAAKAANLFTRFNDAFWNEELGFYAYTLDGDKKPVFSIASNPGQCLWSGIAPPERARRVANRLFEAGHVERLGYPHAVQRPQELQTPTTTRLGRCGRTTTASSRRA